MGQGKSDLGGSVSRPVALLSLAAATIQSASSNAPPSALLAVAVATSIPAVPTDAASSPNVAAAMVAGGCFFSPSTAASSSSSSSSASRVVRGVSPEDGLKYSGGMFRCIPPGAVAVYDEVQGEKRIAEIELPATAINDDFCDCEDGFDEPGTGACAGQTKTMFYCPNEGSLPLFVYTSRVNDGVCDCCDGSDEWANPKRCKNLCAAEGKTLFAQRAQRKGEIEKGLAKRRQLIEVGRKARDADAKRLDVLKAVLPHLELRENGARESVQTAKRRVAKAEAGGATPAAAARSSDEAGASTGEGAASPAGLPDASATAPDSGAVDTPASPDASASSSSSSSSSDGATGAAEHPDAAPATTADTTEAQPESASPDSADSMAAPAVSSEGAPASDTPAQQDGPVISEYTKWMEGAEEVVESSQQQEQEQQPDEVEDEEEKKDKASPSSSSPSSSSSQTAAEAEVVDDLSETMFERIRTGLSSVLTSVKQFFSRKPKHLRLLEQAEKELEYARARIKKKKDEIQELEKRIAARGSVEVDGNLEASIAYSDLAERCISKKIGEYKYEICFFKDAKQDRTSIGKWKSWEADGIGFFGGGQHCPGGPARSLRVVFVCGAMEELLSVEEPSRCTYEATLRHAAACSEELLREVQSAAPRLPQDEL